MIDPVSASRSTRSAPGEDFGASVCTKHAQAHYAAAWHTGTHFKNKM